MPTTAQQLAETCSRMLHTHCKFVEADHPVEKLAEVSGAGNTTKLANQIIVAANIQAVAEALTLAQKAGVDPDLVFQAIKGGLAGSTVMNAKAPMMIEGNDKPGFKIDLHIKDLNNALDCAHTVGAPVPMTAEVQEILQWLHSNGKGQADHSAIAQYYEHLTGIKLGRDL